MNEAIDLISAISYKSKFIYIKQKILLKGILDISILILLAGKNEAVDFIFAISLTVQSNYLRRSTAEIILRAIVLISMLQNEKIFQFHNKGFWRVFTNKTLKWVFALG